MRNSPNIKMLVLLLGLCCVNFSTGQPLNQLPPLKSRQSHLPDLLLPREKTNPFFSSTDTDDSLNVSLVGRWAAGPCYAVAVLGNIACFGNGTYLEIVDFSNPASPVEFGKALLPAPICDITVSGSYIYVADGKAGLYIINFSNPKNPRTIGYLQTAGYAHSITVSGTHAFVAEGDSGLLIVDISRPAKPKKVGFFNTAGSARDVAVSGTYAYVADFTAGLRVIDISNPSTPEEKGFLETTGHANGVAVNGDYVYVADGYDSLLVIDISNPANPQKVGSSGYLGLCQ